MRQIHTTLVIINIIVISMIINIDIIVNIVYQY